MSLNTQWDSLDYRVLDFPYNRIETDLSPSPRIVTGHNTFITSGGKLAKRPGTLPMLFPDSITGRIDRVWYFQSNTSATMAYMIASVYTGSVWKLMFKELFSFPAPWTNVPSYRDINNSTRPHQLSVSRGKAYVKGYPAAASSEKLGTVILNGDSGTITVEPWGILGPQVPATLKGGIALLTADISATTTSITVSTSAAFPGAAPFFIQVGYEQMEVTAGPPGTTWTVTRGVNGTTAVAHSSTAQVLYLNWTASDHIVEVNYGWTYTYAYKSITGQISNRAPLQTNPDKMPSTTGPFFDLCPEIIVQGHADTTNIPTICIYRNTDGGGTFYKLEEIPNTGAGSITYRDDSLASGAASNVFDDPVPDALLGQQNLAPTLVSNSPPPTVLAPKVIGVDTPEASTPIVTYQGRQWYGIGNVLFYSADEELNEGIPEESFPSGTLNGRRGNFIRFSLPIVTLIATKTALVVLTTESVIKILGTNLETFRPEPVAENIGGSVRNPLAITKYGDTVAFLSHDYRVCLLENDTIRIISDPLWTDLVNLAGFEQTISMHYYSSLDKEWLIVSHANVSTPTSSKQWIYDIKKSTVKNDFWFTPWTVPASATIASLSYCTTSDHRLHFAMYNGTSSQVVFLDPTEATGYDTYFGTEIGIDWSATLHQMIVPAGNHVNALRQPSVTPTVYGVEIDRKTFAEDVDPSPSWFFDDLWTDPAAPVRAENPQRRPVSKGFKTLVYTIHKACQHFSAKLSSVATKAPAQILRFTVIWNPDAGA